MADATPAQILLPVAVFAVPTLVGLRLAERRWPRAVLPNAVVVLAAALSVITFPVPLLLLLAAGLVSGFFADTDRSRRTTVRPIALLVFLTVVIALTGNTRADPQFAIQDPIAAALLASIVLATTWLAMTAAWTLGTALPPPKPKTPQPNQP